MYKNDYCELSRTISDDSVTYDSQAEASQGAPKAKHLRLPNEITLEHHVTRLVGAGLTGIVIPGSISEAVHLEHHDQHFYDVTDKSPTPLVIDNFPVAVSGLHLTLDDILRIARHPNVMGVNLKYDNMKNLARETYDSFPKGFFVAGGNTNSIRQCQVLGANGTIAGLANFATYACVRIRELSDRVIARGNSVVTGLGLVGMKAVVKFWNDYGGAPRKPCYLPPLIEVIKVSEDLSELFRAEEEAEAPVTRR
ncbi:hypothetical protein JMJ77_0006574 [Colletotrichum scovillei]|uniref:Dihydrodipicolinate synthase n=1 Tax=Colletotrichum scovillei TaxID=1209932 RepID=A0A9P7RIX3_9PEZI|nr:hypothetical protein JMJ77_0006574 [Colletotrichum scovillei]KAG7077846.1 hypothetical protein JMJ76_0015088 [Colletotrichum scovillei]KAG7084976.1 hypothetical protein JMJ78_0010406 [Colletotrichum scovillei]